MKVWHFLPYSTEKNLGKAYNEYMALVPEGDAGCLQDGDSMHLIPDWGHLIHKYANENPNAVLNCWINRIHPMAKGQLYPHLKDNERTSVERCLFEADNIKKLFTTVTPVTGSVSGTLLVIPKAIWQRFPFSEVNTFRPGEPNLLGVDNYWTNLIRANGVKVLRMDGMLIFHQYRMLTNSKEHLL